MKNINKTISFGFGCLLWIFFTETTVFTGVMGVDEPGTINWSNAWYGCIEDVLILDNDTMPLGVSIEQQENIARFHFVCTTPYLRKLDIKTGEIFMPIRWNYALGNIVSSTEMSQKGRTLFLSQQIGFSFLIQSSNNDDSISQVDRLECNALHPIVYHNLSDSAFFCSGNGKNLHRYHFESTQLQTLMLEDIDTAITDLVIDEDHAIIHVLSGDCSGDIIAVSCDDLQVIDALTLPGNLECRTGVMDHASRQMVLVGIDHSLSRSYLVQVDLEKFDVGAIAEISPSELNIVPLGFYDSNFIAAIPGVPSKLMVFDGEDLSCLDSVDCSDEFGRVKYGALSENSIVVVDDGYPARVDVFRCDPFSFQRSIQFTGKDQQVICSAINPLHDQLMVSRNGTNPAVLILVDLETFSRVGEIDYNLNTSGCFSLLSSDRTGDFTYGYHSGEPAYLVKIRNDDYQIDIAEPLNVPDQCVDLLVDQDASHLFVIYGQTLARHNLLTLELEENIVMPGQPSAGLAKILSDPSRDALLVSNQYGQVFKVSKSPLQVIDETGLTEVTGLITDGIYLADRGSCVYALNDFQQRPARLVELNLDSFSYQDECVCDDLELEISSLVYDNAHQLLNLATYYHWGGILTYNVNPFIRLGENSTISVSRFTEKGVFDTTCRRAYWLNSFLGGRVIATRNTNKGFIAGSTAVLNEEAEIHEISLYSHAAAGTVRLAVYDQGMQLLWESAEIVNTCQEDWIRVAISDGYPTRLELTPGEYRLAFQVSGVLRITSAHSGEVGDGFRQPAAFGPFPERLWYPENTSDRWAIFASWESLFPTMTPTTTPTSTPQPEDTPTPADTMTPTPEDTETPTPDVSATPTSENTSTPTPADTSMPTATATPSLPTETPSSTYTQAPTATQTPTPGTTPPSPTETPVPANTATATSTPTPYIPGVRLFLNQSLYQPGDIFSFSAQVTPALGTPLPVTLWIILDVYGSYWFGPGWTDELDWYKLGRLDRTITESILEFTWPSACGALYDIAFWGAMLQADTWGLIGEYDRIEFGFQE